MLLCFYSFHCMSFGINYPVNQHVSAVDISHTARVFFRAIEKLNLCTKADGEQRRLWNNKKYAAFFLEGFFPAIRDAGNHVVIGSSRSLNVFTVCVRSSGLR